MSRRPARPKEKPPLFTRPAVGVILTDASALRAPDYHSLEVGIRRDTLEVLWVVAETHADGNTFDQWFYGPAIASITYAGTPAGGSVEQGGAPVGTA